MDGGRTALVTSRRRVGIFPGGRWEEKSGFSRVALWYFTSTKWEASRLCLALLVGGSQRFLGTLTGRISTQHSEDDDILS